jgi:hypothetical protein
MRGEVFGTNDAHAADLVEDEVVSHARVRSSMAMSASPDGETKGSYNCDSFHSFSVICLHQPRLQFPRIMRMRVGPIQSREFPPGQPMILPLRGGGPG